MQIRKQSAKIPQTVFLMYFHFSACLLRKMEYNIVETANEAVSWCREPMIRGVVVKGYCSVQEIAKRWGISVRWVNQYALDGRIPGAERLGRSWAIPEDEVKPEKHRSGPKPKEMSKKSSWKDYTDKHLTCIIFCRKVSQL